MIDKVVGCFVVLTLATLVHGDKHEELLAGGYQYFPGVGYYYFGTNKAWIDAQTDCMSTKGRLAVINSEEERQVIVTFLSTIEIQDNYVFGGYTKRDESKFVTTEGIPLRTSEYTKWEEGYPSDDPYTECAGFNIKTGELAEMYCIEWMSYVCEHQLWTDYTYFEGIGYYKLHTEGIGWADAYDACESEGAHLLVINSQAEADAVMQIYNEHPDLPNTETGYYVYIGFRAVFENLTDHSNSGTYLTILGNSISDLGYVKWHAGDPITETGAYCGTLYRKDAAYAMIPCDWKLAFFCEREMQVFIKT